MEQSPANRRDAVLYLDSIRGFGERLRRMYGLKHYAHRLRWSQRRPYVIARSLLATAAVLLVFLFVFLRTL